MHRTELQARARRRRPIVHASLGVIAIVATVAVGLASRVPKAASEAPIFAQIKVGQT
jgi:hypothetical protein